MSDCLSRSDFDRLSSGEMNDDEAARARHHIESCNRCQSESERRAAKDASFLDEVRQVSPAVMADTLNPTHISKAMTVVRIIRSSIPMD